MKKQFFALVLLLSMSGATFCSEGNSQNPDLGDGSLAKKEAGFTNNQELAVTAGVLAAGCYFNSTREIAVSAAVGFGVANAFSLVKTQKPANSKDATQYALAGASLGAAYKWVPPFRGFANGVLPEGWARP